MADDTKPQGPNWLGRPIVDPEHAKDLEVQSALHEFQDKLPRAEAEERAHTGYRREHHKAGAAHHLQGLKAARAIGQTDEAKKHGAMYALHMEAMGHDPYAEPPAEIRQRVEDPERDKLVRFKAHKADSFLLGKREPHAPIEFNRLAKGDVVSLNPPAPTGKKFRSKAEVINARGDFQEKRDFDTVARGKPQTGQQKIVGIHGEKSTFDYSHLLPENARKMGFSVEVNHAPGQGDEFMTAQLKHRGAEISSAWKYPGSGSGNDRHPESGPHPLHGAVTQALQEHSKSIDYRNANDRVNPAPPPPFAPKAGDEVLNAQGRMSNEHLALIDQDMEHLDDLASRGEMEDHHRTHLNRIQDRLRGSMAANKRSHLSVAGQSPAPAPKPTAKPAGNLPPEGNAQVIPFRTQKTEPSMADTKETTPKQKLQKFWEEKRAEEAKLAKTQEALGTIYRAAKLATQVLAKDEPEMEKADEKPSDEKKSGTCMRCHRSDIPILDDGGLVTHSHSGGGTCSETRPKKAKPETKKSERATKAEELKKKAREFFDTKYSNPAGFKYEE